MVFSAYLPCIQNSFIWDDDLNIYENSCLTESGGLLRIWGSFDLYQYYPLTFTSFYLEHILWEFSPAGYHITNILLHAINAILVFFILQRIGLKYSLALFTASLFAIHPIQAESVAWATERKNLLSGVFYFSSFLLYLKFLDKEKNWLYGLSLFIFLDALLSKTTTVTLPLSLLLVEYLHSKSINRNCLLRISGFLIPSIVMGLITSYLETYRYGMLREDWSISALQHVIVAPRVLLFYATKIVLPINMCFIYPKWEIDTNLIWNYWPAMLFVGLGTILWWQRRRITPIIWFGLAHYLVSLLPASGIISFYFMRFSFVQNHFQYLAGLGIMVIMGIAGSGIINRIADESIQSKVSVLLGTTLLIGCGFMTFDQCKIYRNNETLWHDTISKNPDAWIAYNNLACLLNEQGKFDEGITYCQKAIAIHPNFIEVHNNLGTAYMNKGMFDEAISEYKKALAIKPNYAEAHCNLGVVYGNKKMFDEAISEYKKALVIKPNYAEAHCNLGVVYGNKKMFDEAISTFKKAIAINPDYAKAYYNLGSAYANKGMMDDAISEYKKTIGLNPNYANAHYKLGIAYYYYRRDYERAIIHCDQAVALGVNVNPELLELLDPLR